MIRWYFVFFFSCIVYLQFPTPNWRVLVYMYCMLHEGYGNSWFFISDMVWLFWWQENIRRCVCIIYDPSRSNQGVLALKALKLSDSFMELYRTHNFNGEKYDFIVVPPPDKNNSGTLLKNLWARKWVEISHLCYVSYVIMSFFSGWGRKIFHGWISLKRSL